MDVNVQDQNEPEAEGLQMVPTTSLGARANTAPFHPNEKIVFDNDDLFVKCQKIGFKRQKNFRLQGKEIITNYKVSL